MDLSIYTINIILLTLARACAAKDYCSRSVGRSVGLSVGLSARFLSNHGCCIDTKRGYVGMYNGRSAQQESGVVQEQHVYGGGLKLYTAIVLGMH